MITQVTVRPAALGYTPPAATKQLPSVYRKVQLGQNGLKAFVESPALALATDIILVATSGYLAWGLGTVAKAAAKEARAKGEAMVAENPWSTFWWIVAAAGTIKMLHDLSRIQVQAA